MTACRQASAAHVELGQWDHVAKCRLHTATALSFMGRHSEAIKYIEQARTRACGLGSQYCCRRDALLPPPSPPPPSLHWCCGGAVVRSGCVVRGLLRC
jgi:hypothetical protein